MRALRAVCPRCGGRALRSRKDGRAVCLEVRCLHREVEPMGERRPRADDDDSGDWFFGAHDRAKAEQTVGAHGLVAVVDRNEPKRILMYVRKDKIGPCSRMKDWERNWTWKTVITVDLEGP